MANRNLQDGRAAIIVNLYGKILRKKTIKVIDLKIKNLIV